MNNTAQPEYKAIRLPDVKALTGLSRSSIYDRMAVDTFPRNFSLGSKAVAWNYADIQEWIKQQIEASRKTNAQ